MVQQGLKSHAVTMFEVGKLSDESLDSFLVELKKVSLLSFLHILYYLTYALSAHHKQINLLIVSLPVSFYNAFYTCLNVCQLVKPKIS